MPNADRWPDVIEVLACDIASRPGEAPGPDDLMPIMLGRTREESALVVRFDPSAGDLLRQFVDAERLCCAGLGWEIVAANSLELRVTAGAGQLDALEAIFTG